MAEKRIIEINGTATSANLTDNEYIAVDHQDNGTRRTKLSELATWIINKWTAFINALTAVTSFSSGDNVVMVNGTTAKKMAKDTLLELTAQNALAGNVAPEFDPTRTNTNPYLRNQFCVRSGKIYRFKANHFGVWNYSDVDEVLDLTGSFVKVSGDVAAVAPYDDCNNYPVNEIVSCFDYYSSVSNLPISEPFILATLSNSSTGVSRIQYFFGSSNRLFMRLKFGFQSWQNWYEVGAGIVCRGPIDSVTGSAPYNNLNNYPNNEVVLVTDGSANVSNKPTDEQFSVVTISNSNSSSVKMQILNTQTNKTFIRSKFGGSWGAWAQINITNPIHGAGSVSVVAPYDNLNNYPNNEVILITTGYANVLNKPTDEQFSVVTISNSNSSSVKMQILNTQTNKTFIRSKFGGSWGAWNEIGSTIACRGGVDSLTSSAPYNNLNDYPNNEVVLVTDGYGSVENKPIDEHFNIVTISNSKQSTAKIQILNTQTNKTFIRSAFGGVNGDWFLIGFAGNPLIGAFDNMLFIGDSLTWSAVYVDDDSTHVRQAHTTYPEIFAHLCKSTAITKAWPGLSASQWWERFKDEIPSSSNSLAIVYLGTNAGLTDTLDTDAPADQPSSSWSNTNTGCYAKIVDKLKTLGYKVLLVKPWESSGDTLPDTKKVIVEIAERFCCCKVDAPVNKDNKYHYYPDLSGSNQAHYNDLGYSWFASALVNAIATIPETNLDNSLKYIIPN